MSITWREILSGITRNSVNTGISYIINAVPNFDFNTVPSSFVSPNGTITAVYYTGTAVAKPTMAVNGQNSPAYIAWPGRPVTLYSLTGLIYYLMWTPSGGTVQLLVPNGVASGIRIQKVVGYFEGSNVGDIEIYDEEGTSLSPDTAVNFLPTSYLPYDVKGPSSYTLTPTSMNATLTLNGTAFTSPRTISANATISATGVNPTMQVTAANATVALNNAAVTNNQVVTVTPNSTLSVSGNPAVLNPTIGEHVNVSVNGTPLKTGTPVNVSGSSNTITATNTKPTPAVTFSFDDARVNATLNEVAIVSGQPYPLTSDGTVKITALSQSASLKVEYTGLKEFALDGEAVSNGATVQLSEGEHTATVTGAVSIPTVSINGDGITQFSVNGTALTPSNLPYVFTPTGGQTNSIYVTGSDTAAKTLTISGTHIQSITVNNQEVKLPYTVTVTEPLDISVSGEIYQLDVSSAGGAIISTRDGGILSDGSALHTILDITKDTYLSIDGTHTLTVTGTDIQTITINGVTVDVSQLPVTITNNQMSASVVIGGYPPSEIHVTGMYIDTATLDGNPISIGANGTVELEVEVRDENHFLTLAGSQPRQYNLTFDDNGTTSISVDGNEMDDGQVLPIADSKFISALPEPVPVNFDADPLSIVRVDGVAYTGDFSVDVSRETNVQINSSSCTLTIDYGDNSYQLSVPQRMVTLTAPHRNGWIFDTWTSNDVGIVNPRMVQCNIDLTGRTSAHVVANYQRFITCDKPNPWN